MATHTSAAIIANSRTPESVVWNVANDGDVDNPTFQIARATVLAALRDGPLKERLRRTPDWTVFNFGGALADFIRWTIVDGGLDATLTPPNEVVLIQFLADAIEFSIEALGGEFPTACGMLVELRALHSNER